MKRFLMAAIVLGGLLCARADTVTFQFTGTVTQVPVDEVFGDIQFGDPLQGSFTFDTNAVDLIPNDPSTGTYQGTDPLGMTATIGTHQFAANGLLSISVLNSVVDQYTVLALTNAADLTLEIFLEDATGTVFNNDHLPANLSLDKFQEKNFHLDAEFSSGEVQVDGQLKTLAVSSAPEPRSFGALAAGLIVLFARPRVRKFLDPSNRKGNSTKCRN
ncbi:MAG TPA: hypothetical protein VGL72_03555 [Bryobacteraceae bacterium]|jgi:hypothetical protein